MPFFQALFVGAVDGRIQAARLGFITESHRMLYGQAIAAETLEEETRLDAIARSVPNKSALACTGVISDATIAGFAASKVNRSKLSKPLTFTA